MRKCKTCLSRNHEHHKMLALLLQSSVGPLLQPPLVAACLWVFLPSVLYVITVKQCSVILRLGD